MIVAVKQVRRLVTACSLAASLLLCLTAGPQSPARYQVIVPEVVPQGEEFTIRILENSGAGQVDIPAGSQIVVNGTSIPTENGGKARVPAFRNEIGNQFLVVAVGTVEITPVHVEVVRLPQPPVQLRARVFRVSESAPAGGNLRVDGQALNALHDASLKGTTASYPLNDSVGSSLQQIYRCPADLPKGAYHFVAQDASGKQVEAPNPTTNPTLTISGDKIRQRRQRGKFTINSDVEGDVQLSGGEPVIHLDTNAVHVNPGQAATLGFTALQVGNYDVRVLMTTPDWPEATAPQADAHVGQIETNFDPKENATAVTAQIKITGTQGQPIPNTAIDLALTGPQGIQCTRVTTDGNGQATFQDKVPGQVSIEALKLHCYRVRGFLWAKQPPPRQERRQSQKLEYAVKFVCGSPLAPVVAPGRYFTAINVHNPGELPAVFEKKVAVALPGERAGPVSPFFEAHLGPDEALEIDCPDILQHARQAGFLKGFVVIESPVELDVVAVYSAGNPDVETLDIDRVHPRRIAPAQVMPAPGLK